MLHRLMNDKPVLGWREWVSLPELGVDLIKAKVDTGARSSSLHAVDIEQFERDGRQWVRFVLLPWQRSELDPVATEAPLHDTREVRSSTGESKSRPVINSAVRIGGVQHSTELTLTDRSEMGFRMLLGRETIRARYLVDSGRSYRTGKPTKAIRRRNREQTP
jgi:hypothetical protein